MDRVDVILKVTVGAFGTLVSILVGGVGLAFTVLLGMMLLDFITGVMVAIVTKTVSSSVGRAGFIRKLYIIILIGAVYMLSNVIEGMEYIGDGVTLAYIVIEFLSIVENGGKLGVPLPKILKESLVMLKGDDKK